MQVTITATSIGPIVKPDQDAIAWGPTQCLVDAPRSLRLSNPGKIPAPFKVFLRSSRSKYRVDIREGVLAPSEVINIYPGVKNARSRFPSLSTVACLPPSLLIALLVH